MVPEPKISLFLSFTQHQSPLQKQWLQFLCVGRRGRLTCPWKQKTGPFCIKNLLVFGQEAKDIAIIAETSKYEKAGWAWNLAHVCSLLLGLG